MSENPFKCTFFGVKQGKTGLTRIDQIYPSQLTSDKLAEVFNTAEDINAFFIEVSATQYPETKITIYLNGGIYHTDRDFPTPTKGHYMWHDNLNEQPNFTMPIMEGDMVVYPNDTEIIKTGFSYINIQMQLTTMKDLNTLATVILQNLENKANNFFI